MKTRGFTLVEVLVALVIVAAGASAVLSSLNTAATSTAYLRDRTFAEWIANNRIVETRLATSAPQNGKSEGELDYASRRWQWRQQVTEGELPGLRRIDVSVRPAGEAAAGPEDWTLTISGVLGRDIAPPGTGLDWEPVAPGPGGPGAGAGSGSTNAGGANGTDGDTGASGAASPGGAATPGVTEGPRT